MKVLTTFLPIIICLSKSKCWYVSKEAAIQLKCSECGFCFGCTDFPSAPSRCYESQLNECHVASLSNLLDKPFDCDDVEVKANLIKMLPVLAFHVEFDRIEVEKWISFAGDDSEKVRKEFSAVIADIFSGIEVRFFFAIFFSEAL